MEYVLGKRATGKTTALVEKVLKEKGILLTFNSEEAARLISLYPNLNGRCFPIWEKERVASFHFCTPIYVDNADMILQRLVWHKIHGVSFNIGE